MAYAKAVQFSCCCSLDQRILFTALGIIHANATQAPNRWNCRSVTVATATPIDTTVSAKACKISNFMVRISSQDIYSKLETSFTILAVSTWLILQP